MSGDIAGIDQSSTAFVPADQNSPAIATAAKSLPQLSLEFQGLMPPHAEEVKAGLTANIVHEGQCRDKMSVWHDPSQNRLVVLDGFMRLEICSENQLPLPEVNYIDLPDKSACREWIIDQQLNRRNLRGWWLMYFRGLKYNSQKKAAHRPRAEELHQNDADTIGETAKRIASEAGVSEATIERNAKFARSIDQLKTDITEEFGNKILNRDFKKFSLEDVNSLAEKSIEDKKALAGALSENPELSLQEAEESSSQGDTTNTTANNQTDQGDESSGTTKKGKKNYTIEEFKKRQEASRIILYSIQKVENPSVIDNMIKTEEAIINKLKELQAKARS